MKKIDEIKRENGFLRICLNRTVILICAWIFSLILLSAYSYINVSNQIRNNIGNKAMFAAISVSNELELTDLEYERLLKLNFIELLEDSKNIRFEEKARKYMESTDIKYIYVESILSNESVKYKADEQEVVYLLDAVKSDDIRIKDTEGKWYTDRDRYDVLDSEFKNIYESEKATYYLSDGKWGEYVTGYAPFYTDSGRYVGMVGVDIYIEKYYREVSVFLKILSGFVLINMAAGAIVIKSTFKLKTTERVVERIEDHYSTDFLTSVLNRERFLDKLSYAWRNIASYRDGVSILMLDIDHFKSYNDNYGHIYGDEAIKAVCNEVKKSVNDYGGFMGRFGGDEFLIAFVDKGHSEVSSIADELVRKVESLGYKHEYSGVSEFVTISLGGVSIESSRAIPMEVAMEKADIALYKAKRQGRNRSVILKQG
jgi:diguanylate cyclase (GGDEF)-like protein